MDSGTHTHEGAENRMASFIDRRRGRPLDDGEVLYLTPTKRYLSMTTAAFVVIALLALVLLVTLLALTTTVLRSADPAMPLTLPLLLSMWALLLALLFLTAIAFRNTLRAVFAVTTKGLTITPWRGRPRHVPWGQVEELGTVRSGMLAGAVEVTTTDGERIGARMTNSSSRASFSPLPEQLSHLEEDSRGATPPHLVAHHALDEHRRGEADSGI